MTILNTDLVYSDQPTHLIHYIAQKVAAGSIPAPFLSDATFNPISAQDVASAVAHKLVNGGHGHFALRGEKELTIKQIVGIIERASHKTEGSTQASKFNPLLLVEEFFTGLTVDQNMANMVQYFATNKKQPVTGADFWQAEQLKATTDFESFFRSNTVSHASLAEPSYGAYKLPWLNF